MDAQLVSFAEDCNIGSQDFQRTYLIMDYDDLQPLMTQLLGFVDNTGKTRTRPHEHPDHADFWCSSAKVQQNHSHGMGIMENGLDQQLKCIDPMICAGGILVSAVYKPLVWATITEQFAGSNADAFDCMNISCEHMTKSVTISKSPLGWLLSVGELGNTQDHVASVLTQISFEDVRPQRAQTWTSIYITRLMVPHACYPAATFQRIIGTVNQNEITINSQGRNVVFYPETLKMAAPIRSPRTDYLGNQYDDITIRMDHYHPNDDKDHLPCGWNSLFHPRLGENRLVSVVGEPTIAMFGITDRWIDAFNLSGT